MAKSVYIIGNSPYYQAMTDMAKRAGLAVVLSFNTNYEENVPKAMGNILLVETHDGAAVAQDVLDAHFPEASWNLRDSDGVLEVGDTTIVFVDFSKQLRKLASR
jgi:hypothetical protein